MVMFKLKVTARVYKTGLKKRGVKEAWKKNGERESHSLSFFSIQLES